MQRIRLMLLLLLLGLLLPWRVDAQDRALHWERYDYDIEVLDNGDLRYTETQVLVIDRGSFSFGTLSFDTGDYGRVRNITVSEDGQTYRRGTDQPGTFVASDDGQQFKLTYVFRDPSASKHTMVIGYTVGRALIAQDDRAIFSWNFFCGSQDCPEINAGAITLHFPQAVNASTLDIGASGAQVRQTTAGEETRWELTEPIKGQQTRIDVAFPRAILASTANFRSGTSVSPSGQGQPSQPQTQPSIPGGSGGLPISPFFCFIILLVLFFVFIRTRRTAQRGGYGPSIPRTPRRFGGMGGGWGGRYGPRRRRGGWNIPPIIIAPPHQRGDSYGGPFSTPPDSTSGGGGSSWGDSGGGGSSWGDSGGSGSSWGDSGGSGSSWGDSGGGGGSSDSGSGGGDSNSSSFG